MGMKSLVKDQVHVLIRKHPFTGCTQRISFVGSLRDKPTGWKVEASNPPMRVMACEAGTA